MTRYGNIATIVGGKTLICSACNVNGTCNVKPNNTAPPMARSGRHDANTTSARAIHPMPLVVAAWFHAAPRANMYHAPPNAMSAPPAMVCIQRMRATEPPCASTVAGASPVARKSSPGRVR